LRKTAHINPANLEQRILYGGTNVVSGQALAIVIRTGKNTEFGTIAANLTRPEPKSEFEIGAAKFSFFIAKIIFYLVIFIFFLIFYTILIVALNSNTGS